MSRYPEVEWPDADSQGTLPVRCGNYLKPELRGVFAEPEFGAPQSLLFALVKHTLVVCLFRTQQMVNDAGQLVSRGGNRLRLAEFARDAPEELTKVVLGVVE